MSAGKSVLLVDDDEALRQTLSDQLGLHEEFQRFCLYNGRRGSGVG